MDAEQALEQVAIAIANRPPSATGEWYLTFFDGKFRLQGRMTLPPVWPVIITLKEKEVAEGLPNHMWELIRTRIAILISIRRSL